jgi:hypothetical protein
MGTVETVASALAGLAVSGQQLRCDYRSACGEDRALENAGEATIWFESLDRHEQEGPDEDHCRGINRSWRNPHPGKLITPLKDRGPNRATRGSILMGAQSDLLPC